LGLPAKDLIYVGDHPRDIDAGRAAGMQTVLAGFGYLPPNPLITLAEWGATVIIDEPEDLLPLIQSAIGTPHVVS
jgi:phosphoglycolate phosphatase